MDSIDKWLKSLRLHKYTHLFKTMTYEQMLNIDENYLIDLDITKGARNKILVSVKKLNLRPERLMNMIYDLSQGDISMKEALTILKEMLITPIPHPYEAASASPSSVSSSTATSENAAEDLTYLFVDTFGRLVRRLIESDGTEDSACHGIMTDIVDECLKHNSFTHEQKAKMARHKQRIILEQKAKLARNRQRLQQPQQQLQQHLMRERKVRSMGIKQPYHAPTRLQNTYQHEIELAHGMFSQHNDRYYQQHRQPQYESFVNSNSDHHYHYQSNQFQLHHLNNHNQPHALFQQKQQQQQQQLQQQQQQQQQQNQQQQLLQAQAYGEYSLLGPGKTFELPCLRAMAERSSRKSSC